jgi:acetolactate synthase regulatory subunit
MLDNVETEMNTQVLQTLPMFVVTTSAIVGVQRVLTLLRHRNYALRSFNAWDGGPELNWTVECVVAVPESDIALLLARMHRLPTILTADCVLLRDPVASDDR